VPKRRTDRLDLRVSEAEKALLAEAATMQHVSLSAFILAAARERAESVVAERRRVVLDDATFDAFVDALETPVDNKLLRALLAEPSPFENR